MDEEMDFYLRRCIKDWAAGYQPPADGRAKLLKAAEQTWQHAPARRLGAIAYLWALIFDQPVVDFHPDGMVRPYTQSRNWSLYIATQWRLAN